MRLLFLFLLVFAVISTCSGHERLKLLRHGPHHPIRPFQRKPESKNCKTRPIVIAVIDTGFGIDWESKEKLDAHLCKFGHKDFNGGVTSTGFNTHDGVPVDDGGGHGTHIAGLIDKYAKRGASDYCLVILKYYDKNEGLGNLTRTVDAIKYATRIHADFINYSGGGILTADSEKLAVKNYIDGGGTFVAAAGNDGINLDFLHFYPAMDDSRVVVVGALDRDGDHWKKSNYGDAVKHWEPGVDVLSYGMYMSGTSQATAIETGKLVAQTKRICK